MALIPESEFSLGTVTPGDASYPLGSAQNESVPEAGDGTPLTANLVNDQWGFLQALLAAGGVTADGDPDTATDSQYLTALQNVIAAASVNTLQLVYPVGGLLTTTKNGSPESWLGFGTWVRYAGGRVLVGYDAANTKFDGIEETGGAEKHTLSLAEIPPHNHKWYDYNQAGSTFRFDQDGGGTDDGSYDVNGNNSAFNGDPVSRDYWTASANALAGSVTAHNNLQPYITVYIWKRTA